MFKHFLILFLFIFFIQVLIQAEDVDQCVSDIQGCRYRQWSRLYSGSLWRYITGGCCYAGAHRDFFKARLPVVFRMLNGTRDEITDAICRYQDWAELYPSRLFTMVAGTFCVNYTQDFRPNYGLPLSNDYFEDLFVPFTVVDGSIVLFDYTNQTYLNILNSSFSSERFFKQWINCCQLADECCSNNMNQTNVIPNDRYVCPALWDGWDCWPPARGGQTLTRTCPAHIYTADNIECQSKSEKYCSDDGWDQYTNYVTCEIRHVLLRRHSYHLIVLAISTALTLPGVLIFIIFMRSQKGLRSALHRNLLMAIVLKNILTIMSKEIIILDFLRNSDDDDDDIITVMEESGVGCKILTFLNSVSTNVVFTCMFVIGFYLHQNITRVFSKDLNAYWLYAVVIVCSVLPSLVWAILMYIEEQEDCWVVDHKSLQWITDGYKYLILVVNLILLLDIVRVIWTRRSNLNKKQTRSAVKATLALTLLFGLPLLVTSQRGLVADESCVAGDIYYFIVYSIEALQGVLVALLFCYLNKDVHMEIKKSYTQFAGSLNNRFGWNLRVPTQARTTVISNVKT